MHPPLTARREAIGRLAALAGAVMMLLSVPALSQAEESNPNNYSLGNLTKGEPEPGSEETQVRYSFYCDGPITGYQLQSQVPVTGVSSPPTVSDTAGKQLADTFSCSGEIPGWAVNCVGLAKGAYETVTGQFAIEKKLCAEPRVDTLLTVTYAYLEKGVVTQAISGPFDLGRPKSCRPDSHSGGNRLNPKTASKKHRHRKGTHAKKASRR